MDINILLIFFIRKDTLKEVFEKVRKAKPTNLFLFCDGPRNEEDEKYIRKCKEIVENVDWPCNVRKMYSDQNLGCGKGPFTAISWAFEHVEDLIILEDDCVASDSFFPFMQEMLAKYKFDNRIGLISGFNHLKEYDCGDYSYFFTKTGATLGWATWKRVWEDYDFYLNKVNDEYLLRTIQTNIVDNFASKQRIKHWRLAAEETKCKKVNYWDIQFGFLKFAQNYLTVVPKTNLITNIGAGFGATHTSDLKAKKWKQGEILFMPSVDLKFPLICPEFVCCDISYDKKVYKILYKRNIFKKVFGKLKRMIKHG